MKYDAVLVTSFGGPERHEDVIPFLENVLRGKHVPRARMLEVAEHYYHFGGRSPINDQNRALIEALEAELRQAGIATARWLPLACNPAVHRRLEVEKQLDICFVGNMFPGERTELTRLVQRHFRNSFVGRAYGDEMARVYSASRLILNIPLQRDANMRNWEAMACGSLLLTKDVQNGLEELFRAGVHLDSGYVTDLCLTGQFHDCVFYEDEQG